MNKIYTNIYIKNIYYYEKIHKKTNRKEDF